ncbi:MAG: 50S ribosomal protein L3 N(5)-glutamine methyltransferase [Pseudomonadota bacterium]
MQVVGEITTQELLEQMAEELENADLFFGHGTDNAWDEACWLLETIFKRQGVTDLQLDTELKSTQLQQVLALLHERITSRKPLAYLLQEAWFCGLPFYVDKRVLVPRSPLAELIQKQFDPLLSTPPKRILDLCTGSGCIGIACALAFPEADVVLADISPEALEVARINIDKFNLGDRVSLIEADLFDGIEGTFDLIVTNPPYVAADEYLALPEEFHREPELGLVTAREGLDIPLRIFAESANYLRPEGVLIIETGATWPLLAKNYPHVPFLWLEFEFGGEGICLLTKEQLQQQSWK